MEGSGNKALRAWLSAILLSTACGVISCGEPEVIDSDGLSEGASGGKADDGSRAVQVVLTNPHCDICTSDDKTWLKGRSPIVARVVSLIDQASDTVDAAQFTFSVKEIEAAFLRALERGVTVRLAMNAGQDQPGTVASRLRDAGLDVRFVTGKAASGGGHTGIQHAKFMIVDGTSLLTGSNNWSSTGTSINEENTIVVTAERSDPLLVGFACHFEAIWARDTEAAGDCSNDEVAFTPSSRAVGLLKAAIRSAEHSVDVLMHHFTFTDLVKELAKAAERGVAVRLIVNAADRQEVSGAAFIRLTDAGGQIRFKQSNADLYQLMHHKLAIVDDSILLNGSGNWSGSGFFNNFENYVRWEHTEVVSPFVALYERLWLWSLRSDALDAGMSAAEQHANETSIFFGNLHAHHAVSDGSELLDDGIMERHDEHGHPVDVGDEAQHGDFARYAWEYARDVGGLDFLVLSPHVSDDAANDPKDLPNMSPDGFSHLVSAADEVNGDSAGSFVAIPGMEWSTNSTGNHVNIIGSSELCKVARGRFDLLYDGFLAQRAESGDRPLLQFNHPRTFRKHPDALNGNWDQVFDVNLSEIPKNGERTKKFNDFGLDDYPPLRDVHARWVNGELMPDPAVVSETLKNVEHAARPYARLMEVTVGRGKEIRHEAGQNPSLTETEEGGVERYTRVHSDWDYYLRQGFRLAPTAPHDNHYANWGTGHSSRTAVVAPALSEAHLLAALDRRQVYASEDQNMRIRYYAGGRVPMGSQLTTLQSSVVLSAFVSDPDGAGPYGVTVYHGRVGGDSVEPVDTASVGDASWTTIALDVPEAGTHFAYLEIYDPAANRMAWTAPIWIIRPE